MIKIKDSFVIFSLVGGIGDQIFMLGFARTIMKKLKCKLIIDLSYYDNKINYNSFRKITKNLTFDKNIYYTNKIFYLNFKYITYLKYFNLFKNSYIYKLLLKHLFKLNIKNIVFENIRNKKKIIIKNFSKNNYYYGYWHNFKLIKKEKNYFYKEIILKKIKLKKVNLFIKRKINFNTVAIHIRGGDFNFLDSHSLLNISYYKKAIRLIRKKINKPKFHIFTDDIKYAKNIIKNLGIKNEIFFVNKEKFDDLQEFSIFSQYKFAIIANSTFSLMSSFLSINRNLTVGPKTNWPFNKKLTKDEKFKKLKLI